MSKEQWKILLEDGGWEDLIGAILLTVSVGMLYFVFCAFA